MLAIDAWNFGLNHLLALIGFAITLGISTLGFRSFENWKREKIEERRIDIALDALALAYEANTIFDSIRSPISFEWEWSKMKGIEDPDRRRASGPYFAILKRIEHNKDYFHRVWRMQPRFMAKFGKDPAEVFVNLQQARRNIEVSAEMLMDEAAGNTSQRDVEFERTLKNDIWKMKKDRDTIAPLIDAFVGGVEKHSLPVVALRFTKQSN